MDWIYFLLLGAAAGWLAGIIYKGSGFGLFGNMIVGIVGSFIGGFLFKFLQISASNNLVGTLVTAVAGALVLLWIASQISSSKGKRRRR